MGYKIVKKKKNKSGKLGKPKIITESQNKIVREA